MQIIISVHILSFTVSSYNVDLPVETNFGAIISNFENLDLNIGNNYNLDHIYFWSGTGIRRWNKFTGVIEELIHSDKISVER